MTKNTFYRMALLLAMPISLFLFSCSDDDDEGYSDNIENTTANIIGIWYCTYQQWTEDGETWYEEYTPSSTYSMCFDTDGTGYMNSGSDALFEVGRFHSFNWYISESNGNTWVNTDVYEGESYKIDQLNSTTLVMTWTDDDYSITCKFERQQ